MPYFWLVDAFANCFIEAQRLARFVLFHHVSKAAGTSFCKMATANGCSGPRQFSTLWAAGDGPTWGNCARGGKVAHVNATRGVRGRRNRNCAARELSCSRRIAAFEEGHYDFMAVERWLDNGGEVCPKLLWYATLVREPLTRTASHHNHLWRHTLRTKPRRGLSPRDKKPYFARGIFENETACVDVASMPGAVGAPHRKGYDWSVVCALSSNFATRSLLGTRFSQRPYDARLAPRFADAVLIDMARRSLASFAVVVVVERAADAGPILKQALGFLDDKGLPRAGRDASTERKVVTDNDKDDPLLRSHNRLDLDLYAYANDIMDIDLHFFTTSTLFRDPILDDKRTFCDRRRKDNNSPMNKTDDYDDDYSKAAPHSDDNSEKTSYSERTDDSQGPGWRQQQEEEDHDDTRRLFS